MKITLRNILKKSGTALLLFLSLTLFAQEQEDYTLSATLTGIKTSGLHSVLLVPEIRSFSDRNLNDLRIFDSNNNEVPYFKAGNVQNTTAAFTEFPILSRNIIPGKSSVVIFENPTEKVLNEITLAISNSEVTKTYNISGSSDQKSWFGLLNKQQLSDLSNAENTWIYKTIALPKSQYHYFKIEFNDAKTLPIQLLKIGNLSSITAASAMQEIKIENYRTEQLTQKKKTRITLSFHNPQIIDQISFAIKSPLLYRREVTIAVPRTKKYKRKIQHYEQEMDFFELASNSSNTFDIPQLHEKEFSIEIDNQDNPPLVFSDIKLFQSPIHIIADLKAGEHYTLKTGNPNLSEPQYDISSFRNSISKELPEATITQLKKAETPDSDSPKKGFWHEAWIMWACIATGALIIFYFSYSLIKDMKND